MTSTATANLSSTTGRSLARATAGAGPSQSVKVGYLVPEFPGQTHIFFWREINELRRLGIEPRLFSTRRPRADACHHHFRDQAVRQTEYIYPPGWAGTLISMLASPVGLMRALRFLAQLDGSLKDRIHYLGLLVCAGRLVRVARDERLRLVHVHSCADAALLAAIARQMGGPLYSLTLHNPLSVFGPNQRQKWGGAAFAVVITQALLAEVRETLAGALPPRIEVASMGVDLSVFRRQSAYVPWSGRGACRIFTCGRLNPAKGHDDLIRAIASLRDEGLDIHLAIAGEDYDSSDGSYRRHLEQLITQLKLTQRVTLLGSVGEQRVRDELERADVFALASRAEPLGVVIMEAMAMGVPVVATDSGGVPELVTNGQSGLLVRPKDPSALAGAIGRLLNDGDLALHFSRTGQQVVQDGFASEVGAQTLARCIRDTLNVEQSDSALCQVPAS